MAFRIGGVGEGVADDVEVNSDEREHNGREEQLVLQIRYGHDHAPFVDQVAQGGGVHRQAQADVGEEHLVADGRGNGQRHAQGCSPGPG